MMEINNTYSYQSFLDEAINTFESILEGRSIISEVIINKFDKLQFEEKRKLFEIELKENILESTTSNIIMRNRLESIFSRQIEYRFNYKTEDRIANDVHEVATKKFLFNLKDYIHEECRFLSFLIKIHTNIEIDGRTGFCNFFDYHKDTINEYSKLNNQAQNLANSEIVRKNLIEYGFLESDKIKNFTDVSKQSILERINISDCPYLIAILVYVGFIDYLKKNYCKTDKALYKLLRNNIFEKLYHERTIAGNIRVCNPKSKDDRIKYTADKYLKDIEKFISNLK